MKNSVSLPLQHEMAKLGCNNCTRNGRTSQPDQRLYFCECGHILCDDCLNECELDQLCLICREFLHKPVLMDAIRSEEHLVIDGRAATRALQQWDQLNHHAGGQAAMPKQLYINEAFPAAAAAEMASSYADYASVASSSDHAAASSAYAASQHQQHLDGYTAAAVAAGHMPFPDSGAPEVPAAGAEGGSADQCECAVTSVTSDVRVRGREHFVDLSPTLEICKHCRRKESAGGAAATSFMPGLGGVAVESGEGGGGISEQVSGFLENVATVAWNVVTGK